MMNKYYKKTAFCLLPQHQSTTTSCSVCGLGEGYCVNGAYAGGGGDKNKE